MDIGSLVMGYDCLEYIYIYMYCTFRRPFLFLGIIWRNHLIGIMIFGGIICLLNVSCININWVRALFLYLHYYYFYYYDFY